MYPTSEVPSVMPATEEERRAGRGECKARDEEAPPSLGIPPGLQGSSGSASLDGALPSCLRCPLLSACSEKGWGWGAGALRGSGSVRRAVSWV